MHFRHHVARKEASYDAFRPWVAMLEAVSLLRNAF